jgi:hypothetical protein
MKLTTSLFSDSALASEGILSIPDVAPVHIDVVFSSLVSMYLARDHFPHEYCAVVELMHQLVAGNCGTMRKDDIEVFATIVVALNSFPDQKRGLVTDLFLGSLDKFVFGRQNGAVDCSLELIPEFRAPFFVRLCIADLTSSSTRLCRKIFNQCPHSFNPNRQDSF